jgi:hypothetical protein
VLDRLMGSKKLGGVKVIVLVCPVAISSIHHGQSPLCMSSGPLNYGGLIT